MEPLLSESEFSASVADHMMMVVADGAQHRHLHFSAPNTSIASFDIVTWPGYLAITGDMGSFLFKRIPDMFQFFRQDKNIPVIEGQSIIINPQFWSEKLEAVDKDDGNFEEFSPEKFRQRIGEILDEEEAGEELRSAVAEQVLAKVDLGEHQAISAAEEFLHDGFSFVDFFDSDCQVFTYRFLWCCYAIVWAIGYYDEMKAAVAAETKSGPVAG